jgi:hypothetical protein
MIVFESDYILWQCLEAVYPHAFQILIAEGPVKYWQDQGRTTSTDETNEILHSFPDPDHKIKIIHGQFSEKDEQCQAYMKLLNPNTTHLWNLDSDEIFKDEDIQMIKQILIGCDFTSIGVKSCSFYGGFERHIGGFEEATDQFLRIFKVCPGAKWLRHRPPTIAYPAGANIDRRHLDSDTLFNQYGIRMYHYSYVFPDQVFKKINYYKTAVSRQNCIDGYFARVYLPWILGNDEEKKLIESQFNGVHEFIPSIRTDTFTKPFEGKHPESIEKTLPLLRDKFKKQLEKYV